MKHEREYRERCAARGLDADATDRAVDEVRALEAELAASGASLEQPDLSMIEARVATITASGAFGSALKSASPAEAIMALARYFATAREEAIAIRLLAYLLPIGVLPAMEARLGDLEGDGTRKRVMGRVRVPAEGSPPESYPAATGAFVEALEAELGPERSRRVLTCNVHGIPPAAFAGERERFLELGSVDAWLADYHGRQVEELARHAADGTLWFEQRITWPVVEFVRSRPEVQGGVREGGTIFTTKIPYDPDRFLRSADPLEKRRLSCHCPMAASAISERGSGVPPAWCACSAGYEKVRFDAVFGAETEATVLESALAGDERCRFAIRIPAGVS